MLYRNACVCWCVSEFFLCLSLFFWSFFCVLRLTPVIITYVKSVFMLDMLLVILCQIRFWHILRSFNGLSVAYFCASFTQLFRSHYSDVIKGYDYIHLWVYQCDSVSLWMSALMKRKQTFPIIDWGLYFSSILMNYDSHIQPQLLCNVYLWDNRRSNFLPFISLIMFYDSKWSENIYLPAVECSGQANETV